MKTPILYYLNKAKIKSKKSNHYKVKIGAILVNKGKVVSTGFNKLRHNRHRQYSRWQNSVHAEIDCLLKAGNSAGGTLYVYRENKNGELAICKPCIFCQILIREKNIKKIIYTTSYYPNYVEEYI